VQNGLSTVNEALRITIIVIFILRCSDIKIMKIKMPTVTWDFPWFIIRQDLGV